MILVLIAGYYFRFMPIIEGIESLNVTVIKRDGIKVFFKVETTLSQKEVMNLIKKEIKRHKECSLFSYQLYGVYHGMIDLFDYLTIEAKNANPYYNQTTKDIEC